jgi:hypothetical protein
VDSLSGEVVDVLVLVAVSVAALFAAW